MPDFGEDIDITTFLDNLIKILPKINSVDARIVMQDQYEHRFGIFDHGASKNRPLSSVAMFECENYTERSAYYDALLEYAEGNYKEIWGLNVDEFLNRPQYIVKMMRMATEEVMRKKINAINDVSSQVKNEHNSPRQKKPR